MQNYKPSLIQLLKQAWNDWRTGRKDDNRMKEYMEVISLHSKKTGSFGRADHESGVMQAYFRACKAKEAEVAKNVRAMVFGASDQEKDSLKASLMSLGIDLDSIMGEADAADGLTAWKVLEEFNAKNTNDKTYDEVPDPDPKNTRKAIYVDIGDMSREEAEEYIDRLMKQHKINTKPLYDPRKSVSGATTDDMPFNSVWPEVIHSTPTKLSLEETIKTLVTGETTPQPEPLPPDPKMEEYVQAIHENVIVPSAKSLDTLPMTVFIRDKELRPEFEKPIPQRKGELPLTTTEIATVTTDTVSIDQMPEGTTFTPTAEKEYIETAVTDLDNSPPEQSEGAPEPSSSSEEQKQ